ncbi:RskA family anti-sigma factor [Nocardia camponoti]|uniref:Anti-sigma-K factor RskA N-terminal domain-containing protein n=1 Tax=Nocardia camponoti TaxID=1616106 RepID=A0A917QBT1_9NOCA|nr:hypothetical protein [Nocardia camponoti]GGK41475.1 hypothetical protein GCM10011591_11190 [Nocardia camponoti]
MNRQPNRSSSATGDNGLADGKCQEFYRATGAAAFGLALRVLHRRGLAEDVVREGYRRSRALIMSAPPSAPEAPPNPSPPDSAPDLQTPWGRAEFGFRTTWKVPMPPDGGQPGLPFLPVARRDYAYGPPPRPEPPAPARHSHALLAQVHRVAIEQLRADRNDRNDLPWFSASARLGFADPLDPHLEVFVLAYYGGRTYRGISRETGMAVPTVTRLLGESIDRLAEQRAVPNFAPRHRWRPPRSVLALADAYALDAVAELERHHIQAKLATIAAQSGDEFDARVTAVHDLLARLAKSDERPPPRHLEARILADFNGAASRRGYWAATRPPWLRRPGDV